MSDPSDAELDFESESESIPPYSPSPDTLQKVYHSPKYDSDENILHIADEDDTGREEDLQPPRKKVRTVYHKKDLLSKAKDLNSQAQNPVNNETPFQRSMRIRIRSDTVEARVKRLEENAQRADARYQKIKRKLKDLRRETRERAPAENRTVSPVRERAISPVVPMNARDRQRAVRDSMTSSHPSSSRQQTNRPCCIICGYSNHIAFDCKKIRDLRVRLDLIKRVGGFPRCSFLHDANEYCSGKGPRGPKK